jgi:glutathione S-transferase
VELIAIVTVLILLQTFVFAFQVGKARAKHGVNAPEISGNSEFENAFRVHQNTVEQVVLVIPALWIFGTYVHELAGAGIGLLFIIARFIYRGAYLNDPSSRTLGFGLGALSLVVLMLGGLIGAVMKMMAA